MDVFRHIVLHAFIGCAAALSCFAQPPTLSAPQAVQPAPTTPQTSPAPTAQQRPPLATTIQGPRGTPLVWDPIVSEFCQSYRSVPGSLHDAIQ